MKYSTIGTSITFLNHVLQVFSSFCGEAAYNWAIYVSAHRWQRARDQGFQLLALHPQNAAKCYGLVIYIHVYSCHQGLLPTDMY